MNLLKSRLRGFKLSGIYNSLEERIDYAKQKNLSYTEFLELLLEDEANNRRDNSTKRGTARLNSPITRPLKNLTTAFNHQ